MYKLYHHTPKKMNLSSKLLTFVGAFTLTATGYSAAITTVVFDSGDKQLTALTGNAPLTAGSAAVEGDGAVIQLGYFSGATSQNLFLGTWIPLTGEGSANTAFNRTSVGDSLASGAGDGQFGFSLSFNDALSNTSQNLPAPGTPLAIRFYDGRTLALSTRFETISSSAANWQWKAPGTPATLIGFSLGETGSSGLRLQSTNAAPSPDGVVRTATPVAAVPEPSSLMLLSIGALVSLRRRRS